MKRAILTGPGHFRIDDMPVPKPGPDEALVRIQAIGICGSDLHLFKEGVIGGIRIEDAGGPFSPGHECMGVVEDAGAHADRTLVGRRVFVEPANSCGKCRWCVARRLSGSFSCSVRASARLSQRQVPGRAGRDRLHGPVHRSPRAPVRTDAGSDQR
ncbi:MAG: alcohol dehydrogenase catalytic domain-containing protein [Planctomycetota bacterium]|nr:alcohol dehydrogenase catalytic domain-containing protein [Planctomycetota bacterium]